MVRYYHTCPIFFSEIFFCYYTVYSLDKTIKIAVSMKFRLYTIFYLLMLKVQIFWVSLDLLKNFQEQVLVLPLNVLLYIVIHIAKTLPAFYNAVEKISPVHLITLTNNMCAFQTHVVNAFLRSNLWTNMLFLVCLKTSSVQRSHRASKFS